MAAVSEGRRVADELRQAILAGDYVAGSALRQDELAYRFAATRMPVREAIRALHREGLVQMKGSRAAVAEFDARDLAALYQMRERIEPLALQESLPRLTTADLGQLDGLQASIEATEDLDEFLRLDQELHLLTYSRCDVAFLRRSVTDLWNATHPYRRAFMLSGGGHRFDIATTEHRLFLDAIRRRDFPDAERYLVGHIRRTRIELQSPTVTAEQAT